MAIIDDERLNHLIDLSYQFFCNNVYDIGDYLSRNNIYATDNINEDLEMFCDTTLYLNAKGITILPNDIIDKTHILVNIAVENNDYNSIIVLFHEFYHVKDFIEYAKKYNDSNIEGINSSDLFTNYKKLSEFNAYANSELLLIKLYTQTGIDIYQEYIKPNQEAFFSEYLQRLYENITNDNIDYNSVMALLGKFYIFDYCNQNKSLEESCIHNYLIRFSEEDQNYLLYLYAVCLKSLVNPFDSLNILQEFLEN